MSYDADIVVIGAGIIGLAVASEVAKQGREVYVLERDDTFGNETSSRNSEVIHISILYPEDSLNARHAWRATVFTTNFAKSMV